MGWTVPLKRSTLCVDHIHVFWLVWTFFQQLGIQSFPLLHDHLFDPPLERSMRTCWPMPLNSVLVSCNSVTCQHTYTGHQGEPQQTSWGRCPSCWYCSRPDSSTFRCGWAGRRRWRDSVRTWQSVRLYTDCILFASQVGWHHCCRRKLSNFLWRCLLMDSSTVWLSLERLSGRRFRCDLSRASMPA